MAVTRAGAITAAAKAMSKAMSKARENEKRQKKAARKWTTQQCNNGVSIPLKVDIVPPLVCLICLRPPPSLMTMSYQGEVASPPGLSKLNNATKASLFSVSTSTMPTLFATMAPLFSISTSMLLPRAEVLLLLQVMRLLIRFISFIKSAALPLNYNFCYHKISFYQVKELTHKYKMLKIP